ncbi:MAG TPA: hypothetical protein VNH11_04415 [Pirellulales bacterium]|nr:hypothetical protein [Pirellulales bacterium]
MKHRCALIALGLAFCAGCGDLGGNRRQASGSAGGAGLVGSDINALAAPAQPAQPAGAAAPVAPPAAMTGPPPNLPGAAGQAAAQPPAPGAAAAPATPQVPGSFPGLPGVTLPGQPPPSVVTEKAQAGVTGKGNYGPGVVTTPVSVYFQAQERLIFLQVDQAMNLYEGEHGFKPKTEEEFMKKIIEFNQIRLPQLQPGYKYKYDPQKAELLVEHPQP